MNMRIWIDDVRPAPEGYVWCRTTNEAKNLITCIMQMQHIENTSNLPTIELIDIDHDAGDYAKYGGDYIKILDWLEGQNYHCQWVFRIHSMNSVGRENMRRIIERNGWKEIA